MAHPSNVLRVVTNLSSTGDPASGSVLPSVSIVVPTQHRRQMLSQLLESLRWLTYPPRLLELIVVGGDSDPGREAVQSFAHSVDFLVTYRVVPEHTLHSASFKRNEGARSARGHILAFTDDDCIAHPDWISGAVPFFQALDVGGVEGAVEIPKPDQPTLTYRGSQRLSLSGAYQTCNILYRRSVFEECGGFDLHFPYYLEDTDLAYTVLEGGWAIPFAAGAVVQHPVQPGRPLKLLTIARTTEHLPYLFVKHAGSKTRLQSSFKLLNRAHYPYLALYATALLIALRDPIAAAVAVGVGLFILVSLHLAYDFWGLRFTVSELVLTGLCQPIVPLLRLFYWLRGAMRLRLSLKRYEHTASGQTRPPGVQ